MSNALHHVSASQITTYRACKRLWAIEKLAELRREERANLTMGKDVHGLIEHYLTTGQVPAITHEHRTKFDSVVPFLPAPKTPGMLVEHVFSFPVYDGGTDMVGGIDVALPPWLDGTDICAGVDDHKTTSDMKYAKTPEELATNTQLIIYAYFLFRLPQLNLYNILPDEWRSVWVEGIDRVRVRHNYIKTRNVIRRGQAQQVEAWLTWEMVAKEWAGIVIDVKEMEALAARLYANTQAIVNEPARIDYLIAEVEGDKTGKHCNMYRGCDMKAKCPEASSLAALAPGIDPEYANLFQIGSKPTESKENTMDNATAPTDDLATRLAAKMAARKPAGAPAAPSVTPPPERECNGRRWFDATTQAPPDHKCAACAHREGQPEVSPPDAPSPTMSAADIAADAPPIPSPEAVTPAKRTRKAKAAPAPAAATTATPAAETPASEPASASQAQPAQVAADAPVIMTPGELKVIAEAAGVPAPSGKGKPCSRLYINCRPLVGPDASADPLGFERWISGVLAAIRDELKVPHYKLLKYGTGAGALATAMEAKFAELPEVVIVYTRRPEAQEFLSIAMERAAAITGAE